MKKINLLLVILLISTIGFSQRYLYPVFSSVTVLPKITYGRDLNINDSIQNLLLDFYEPSGDVLSKRPLIIYLHGGGFSDTNQTRQLSHIVVFCKRFALRGYAVASIDYRLDSPSTGLSNRAIINAMHDSKASVRFFKTNAKAYKIDTTKIFIGGESAGAITGLNTGYINTLNEVLYPKTLPVCVDKSVEGNAGNKNATSSVTAILCFSGGTKHISLLPVFDTLSINSPLDPPTLFVQGGSDPIIPLAFADEIKQRLDHLSIYNEFKVFPGATHCPWFDGLPNSSLYLDSLVNYTSDFLYNFTSTRSGISDK